LGDCGIDDAPRWSAACSRRLRALEQAPPARGSRCCSTCRSDKRGRRGSASRRVDLSCRRPGRCSSPASVPPRLAVVPSTAEISQDDGCCSPSGSRRCALPVVHRGSALVSDVRPRVSYSLKLAVTATSARIEGAPLREALAGTRPWAYDPRNRSCVGWLFGLRRASARNSRSRRRSEG
jgi:hypothetical protein